MTSSSRISSARQPSCLARSVTPTSPIDNGVDDEAPKIRQPLHVCFHIPEEQMPKSQWWNNVALTYHLPRASEPTTKLDKAFAQCCTWSLTPHLNNLWTRRTLRKNTILPSSNDEMDPTRMLFWRSGRRIHSRLSWCVRMEVWRGLVESIGVSWFDLSILSRDRRCRAYIPP